MQRSLCPVQPLHMGLLTKQYGPSFHEACTPPTPPGEAKTGIFSSWMTILLRTAMSPADAGPDS